MKTFIWVLYFFHFLQITICQYGCLINEFWDGEKCTPCTQCPPGVTVEDECLASSDRVCDAQRCISVNDCNFTGCNSGATYGCNCKDNSYTTSPSSGLTTVCNPTFTNGYCTSGNTQMCLRNTRCGPKSYFNGIQCTRCTVCPLNVTELSPCTATADRVCDMQQCTQYSDCEYATCSGNPITTLYGCNCVTNGAYNLQTSLVETSCKSGFYTNYCTIYENTVTKAFLCPKKPLTITTTTSAYNIQSTTQIITTTAKIIPPCTQYSLYEGYFYDYETCRECTNCSVQSGVLEPCTPTKNTVCGPEPCQTFADCNYTGCNDAPGAMVAYGCNCANGQYYHVGTQYRFDMCFEQYSIVRNYCTLMMHDAFSDNYYFQYCHRNNDFKVKTTTTTSQLLTTSTTENLITTSTKQATTSTLQATTSTQLATTSTQLATTSTLQATTSTLQATTSTQLATTSSQSATTSAQPATTSTQPATTSTQPTTTSSQPTTSTNYSTNFTNQV